MATSLEFNAAVGTLSYALHLASNGQAEEALTHLHEARAVLTTYPASPELAETLAHIACVHQHLGNHVEAQPYASAALDMLHEKETCQRAYLNQILGNIHQKLENHELAAQHYRHSADLYSTTEHVLELVESYKYLAYNLTKAERREEARRALRDAIEVCTNTDPQSFVQTIAEFYYLLGTSYYNDGNYEHSRLNYLVAKNLFDQQCARINSARCLEAVAHVASIENQYDLAAQLFFEAAWDYDEEGCFEDSERASDHHHEVLKLLLQP